MEYTQRMYLPAINGAAKVRNHNYSLARSLSAFEEHMQRNWSGVHLLAEKSVNSLKDYKSNSGQEIFLSVTAQLGAIDPADVMVEVYYGALVNGALLNAQTHEMQGEAIVNAQSQEMQCDVKSIENTYKYFLNLKIEDGGEYAYTFRVTPKHPDFINRFALGLIRWVE